MWFCRVHRNVTTQRVVTELYLVLRHCTEFCFRLPSFEADGPYLFRLFFLFKRRYWTATAMAWRNWRKPLRRCTPVATVRIPTKKKNKKQKKNKEKRNNSVQLLGTVDGSRRLSLEYLFQYLSLSLSLSIVLRFNVLPSFTVFFLFALCLCSIKNRLSPTMPERYWNQTRKILERYFWLTVSIERH